VATAFQSSLTLGETFTVLTASSVSGTFSNSTIAISGTSFQFDVSYTATGVVLTVAAAAPSGSHSQQAAAEVSAKPATVAAATGKSTSAEATSGLRQASGARVVAKPIVVAGIRLGAGHSNAIVAGTNEWNNLRSWERIPVMPVSRNNPAAAQMPRAVNESRTQRVATSDLEMGGGSHAIGMPARSWMGTAGSQHIPVKIQQPMLTRIAR
jgi:hypothetical protein